MFYIVQATNPSGKLVYWASPATWYSDVSQAARLSHNAAQRIVDKYPRIRLRDLIAISTDKEQ